MARRALVSPAGGFRDAMWVAGGRYCIVRGAQETLCFAMVPEAGSAAFAASRGAQAAAARSADDRAAAVRSARLAGEFVREVAGEFRAEQDTLRLKDGGEWIPSSRGGAAPWGGPGDLSVAVRVAQRARTDLEVTVEVVDDRWIRCDGDGGNGVEIGLGEFKFLLGMDDAGRAVVRRLDIDADAPPPVPGQAPPPPLPVHEVRTRMVSETSLRYSFVVPGWQRALRFETDAKTKAAYVGFNIAVRDDDGEGVKGQLEWGLGRGQVVVK